MLSLTWTLVSGVLAVIIGFSNDSLVLVAFGFLSLLDAAGSAALIVHFRHALRHEAISHRLENSALRIITIGMTVLGIVTTIESIVRLLSASGGSANSAGVALAGSSLGILAVLSITKRRIAAHIPSHALLSDGWLSAMGSLLALVTLTGTALQSAYGWWWLDPSASLIVGVGAICLSVVLARGQETHASKSD
jgi:divalent metal cation (Fe/Co/Zn/Cd) transporter